ncbi:MAG: hypothetical protein HYS08_08830 [Chlamydiae bacterium]|nr:hypothetical protein [Chlamydiota bacterium]MBI3265467.1 hypothetical protein [Chlamydiota bacterium]
MKRKSLLLGLGFDHRDRHLRVTRGENFHLVGGSEKTHSKMQEKAISLNEELSKRKKTLEDVSREEFMDIARDIGLEEMH